MTERKPAGARYRERAHHLAYGVVSPSAPVRALDEEDPNKRSHALTAA